MSWETYDKPGEFFGAGYALASSEIKFTTNDNGGTKLLTKLTDTEANATTGDTRKVLFALLDALYQKWVAMAVADRPTKVSVGRFVLDMGGDLRRMTYSFTFDVSITGEEVVDE